MKSFTFGFVDYRVRAAAAALTALLCLSSCDDDEKKTNNDTPQQTATAENNASAEAREALFQAAVFGLAQKVTDPARYPDLNPDVKDFLELLNSYYETLSSTPGTERVRVGLQIAQTTRDLSAYPKAGLSYEQVLKDVEALTETEKNSTEIKRALSAAYSGTGACLLAQNKATEALPWYEKALAMDESLLQAVGPEAGQPIEADPIPEELSRAAADVLGSYRCLGDCQRLAGATEEARETYLKGNKLASELKKLSPDMSIAYVKLLMALGNLDNDNGSAKTALAAWRMAANICRSLNASSPRMDIKAETKRRYDTLAPAIQAVDAKLQAEQPAEDAEEDVAQTEPLAPLPEPEPANTKKDK